MLLQPAGWATEADVECFSVPKQLATVGPCRRLSTALLAAGLQKTLPTAMRSSSTAPPKTLPGRWTEPFERTVEEMHILQHCAGWAQQEWLHP